jgi:DNA polymerase I-like protein with 3'-5' exonuclease and polymerase domains
MRRRCSVRCGGCWKIRAKPKLGHNLKYDLLVLRNAGVELRGLTNPGSCDSMVASYLIDASRSSHSLDALALALLESHEHLDQRVDRERQGSADV